MGKVILETLALKSFPSEISSTRKKNNKCFESFLETVDGKRPTFIKFLNRRMSNVYM